MMYMKKGLSQRMIGLLVLGIISAIAVLTFTSSSFEKISYRAVQFLSNLGELMSHGRCSTSFEEIKDLGEINYQRWKIDGTTEEFDLENGLYEDCIKFTVGEDGKVTVGMSVQGNWVEGLNTYLGDTLSFTVYDSAGNKKCEKTLNANEWFSCDPIEANKWEEFYIQVVDDCYLGAPGCPDISGGTGMEPAHGPGTVVITLMK